MPSQLNIPTHQSLIAQSPAIGSLVLTYRSEGVKFEQRNLTEQMKVVLLGNTVQLEGNLATDTWNVASLPSRGYEDLVMLAQRFGAIDIANGVERLVEYLRVMEPRLKRLMLIPMRGVSQIHGEMEGLGALPIRCMGDGVDRLISILLCLMTPPTVVLVDEIGSGIHHSALPRMWKLLAEVVRETGCQLFGTTHSYECIQAAIQGLEGNKKDQELFRYIRLQRPKEGSEIKPVVLNYNDAASAVESNLEIR
ncbi:AAA domain [Chthonomonas calidirosea]|nr:AAA domain [Chthonomonas calidirosea]